MKNFNWHKFFEVWLICIWFSLGVGALPLVFTGHWVLAIWAMILFITGGAVANALE